MLTRNTAKDATGSLAEAYLKTRGLELPAYSGALRFHAGLRHPSGAHSYWLMIALVLRGTHVHLAYSLGISIAHFWQPTGAARQPFELERLLLGPCRGGAVQLAPVSHGDTLLVGERHRDICLPRCRPAAIPVGAAVFDIRPARARLLPLRVRQVIVLADGDDPGEAAAVAAAQRWVNEGRQVRIARAPRGQDFNDVLDSPERQLRSHS